jgi:polysaccharide pyruvyl transferase WcaK-like protein
MTATRDNATRFSQVSIFGASLDAGNRGVTALGESVASLILSVEPSAEIAFHYYARRGGRRPLAASDGGEISILNCRLSPLAPLAEQIWVILALALLYRLGVRAPARRNPWLSTLLRSSFIADIRGGDSLSDIYGARRFLVGCLPLLSVLLLGRPYVLLPQTYGPFRTSAARWVAALTLHRATDVWTRDHRCGPVVHAIGRREARFSPDVAFTLAPVPHAQMSFDPADLDIGRAALLIGLNVSGLLYMGGYTGDNMFGLRSNYRDTINHLVSELLSRTNATLLIVPHTFGAEQESAASAAVLDAIRDAFPRRAVLLTSAPSARAVKGLIGRTHFFIGSRMHACIAALSQHIPTVGLGYSDKFLGVFESAGIGDAVVDLRQDDAGAVSQRVLTLLEQRAAASSRLADRITVVQRQVREAFTEMATASSARGGA